MQATKSIEEKTISETVNYIILAEIGLKEQAENGTVVKQEKQVENDMKRMMRSYEDQTKNSNSMFYMVERKVRLKKYNLKISYIITISTLYIFFCSQRES